VQLTRGMFRPFISWTALTAALFVLSCQPMRPHVDPPEDDGCGAVSSDTLTVHLFLDASGSMRGFVQGTQGVDYYSHLLESLELLAIKSPKPFVAKFYRFGGDVHEIQRNQYYQARNRDGSFFTEPETRVDKVVESAGKAEQPHLVCVVTDLFQEDSDINLLTAAIRQSYLARGLAVGMLGIRSSFCGKVSDVGPSRVRFSYSGLRPFYVLCLGRLADVTQYLLDLQSDLSTFTHSKPPPETRMVIYNKLLSKCITSQDAILVRPARGVTRVHDIVQTTRKDDRILQFIVNQHRKDPPDALFTATVKYEAVSFSLPFDGSKTTYEVIAEKYDKSAKRFVPADEASGNFSVHELRLQPESLTFRAALSDSTLKRGVIYKFRLVILPRPDAYALPDWVKDWSFNINDVLGPINGSRTFNLAEFLRSIGDINVRQIKPSLAHLDCYIDDEAN